MYRNRQLLVEDLSKFTKSCKETLDSVSEEFGWSSISMYSAFKREQHIIPNAERNVNVGSPTKDENVCVNNTSKQIDLKEGLNKVTVGSNPLYKELVDSLSKPANAVKDEKSKTEALIELLKMERDAKRRRINYKNRVHTKNKSHIEIMREVLAEQMSTLTQQTENENSFMTVKEEDIGKFNSYEELIEIKFPNGNPYLAWKSVLEINNSSDSVKKEDISQFDDENQTRYRYSDYSKIEDFDNSDHRKDFKKGRNSKYDESKSQFSGTRSKGRSLNSKYNPIKYEEIKSKYYTSRYNRKSNLKHNSSSHEGGGSKYNNYRHNHIDYRNISPDRNCKEESDGYYKEGECKYSGSQRHKRDTKYSENERQKRDRSYSVSPSRRKTKKHKSKHKRH